LPASFMLTLDRSYRTPYRVHDFIEIKVSDPDANRDPVRAETVTVYAVVVKLTEHTSNTDPKGISVPLKESGINTGVFVGRMEVKGGAASSGTRLRVSVGDRVQVFYRKDNEEVSAYATIVR